MEWSKLTVVFLLSCVLQCSAMSYNELEDFSNFLAETSKLDTSLLRGHDGNDEDEVISDHAWEDSGKFEGDLILNEKQRRSLVDEVAEGLSRNGLKDTTKRWPDNEVIYYIQKEHFSRDQVQAIKAGIEDLARASCVKFRPHRKGDQDTVVIVGNRNGCFSQVGYQGGLQVLNLSRRHPVGRGCFRHGTVVHELLHTLGFYHMQSSPDRDDYIDVVWENIVQPARHNFRKYNTFSVSDFGVGYDYDSVLHYSRRAFSSNGQDTLVPKQSGASIGQRVGLSDKDSQKLNKMYCDADSDNVEAAEEVTKKPVSKKKKNKPFDGHGIGYHQGKAVVIKLPTVETYKLPDIPHLHLFDYFSKVPQIATTGSLIEGFGTGEKIDYTYKPPPQSIVKDYKDFTEANKTVMEETDTKPNEKDEDIIPTKLPNSDKAEDSTEVANKSESEEEEEYDEDEENIKPTEKKDHGLDEAFDRLGKIIKTHVYPSQTPDFSIYKPKDYSEFYAPQKSHKTDSIIHKLDEKFHSPSTNTEKEKKQSDNSDYTNIDSYTEFVKNFHSPTQALHATPDRKERLIIHSNEQLSNDEIKDIDDPYVTPEYATLEHLKDKHNYSGLYRPKSKDHDVISRAKHALIGYVVPKSGYHKIYDDFKKLHDEAGINDHYTSPSEDSIEGRDEKIYGPISDKQAYSLFGVLVPISRNFYKLKDPHDDSFSVGKPDSSEDKSR